MEQISNLKSKSSNFFWQIFGHYSWIPLLALFVDGLHQIYFLVHLKEAPVRVALISSVWVALQVIFATFFGLLSDKFCRKKVLMLGLVSSFFSILLLNANWFWSAIFLNGILGNVGPIARAAYCDVQLNRSKESNIINTFLLLPLPYIFLSFDYKLFLHYSSTFVHAFDVFIIIICGLMFKDQRDKEHKDVSVHLFMRLKNKFF